MKLLASILSLYVMILVFMPCADAHISNSDYFSIIQQDQEDGHSGDIEFCSPFCFCTCCQTPSVIHTQIIPQVSFLVIEIIAPLLLEKEIVSNISFWRPPKYNS
ncbi:DUF6660 family protein [Ancylomarina longa]|uniref:DUF2946 domain-containing protein n=1 Tax=Ancylomarina longa TaxID=2487017 RepID=A0A434AYK4_9BACT|nr:hypothetical protein DLK05_02895 [Ancylomarina longa]